MNKDEKDTIEILLRDIGDKLEVFGLHLEANLIDESGRLVSSTNGERIDWIG